MALKYIAVLTSIIALAANAQTVKPTLPQCQQVAGVVQIVTNSDGTCTAYKLADLSKRPDYAKSDAERGIVAPPAALPALTLEERIKALEDKALIR